MGPKRDVTAEATWSTSDDNVGIFRSPGYLTTLSDGQVEIAARLGPLPSNPMAFAVSPAGAPERMLSLSVIASDPDDRRVPGVDVDVVPDRGARQSCRTSSTGHCTLWVFDTTIHVSGTKAGYEPAQTQAVNMFGGESWFRRADLIMRPR
jgi:hypothetical protein